MRYSQRYVAAKKAADLQLSATGESLFKNESKLEQGPSWAQRQQEMRINSGL